jgi:hypothetical protein
LASPLPPWRSTISGCAFEVFPRRPASEIRCRTRGRDLPRLASPSELSFQAGLANPPLVGSVVRSSPPTWAKVSTPGDAFATPSGERCQPSAPVPPSQFRTAWATCSTWASRVCCAPLPVGCSPRFADSRPWDHSRGSSSSSSRRCSHPSKNSSSTAAPRHRGPCLHAVCSICRVVRERTRASFPKLPAVSQHARTASRSPPSERLVWGRSACAALPGSVSPRASESWSADILGFPRIPDGDSVVRCRPRRSVGTGAMGPRGFHRLLHTRERRSDR